MFPDIVCFCHLRWNFVYQRPQHLLSRFARQGRVFVIEEPVFDAGVGAANFHITKDPQLELWIVEPLLRGRPQTDRGHACFLQTQNARSAPPHAMSLSAHNFFVLKRLHLEGAAAKAR